MAISLLFCVKSARIRKTEALDQEQTEQEVKMRWQAPRLLSQMKQAMRRAPRATKQKPQRLYLIVFEKTPLQNHNLCYVVFHVRSVEQPKVFNFEIIRAKQCLNLHTARFFRQEKMIPHTGISTDYVKSTEIGGRTFIEVDPAGLTFLAEQHG